MRILLIRLGQLGDTIFTSAVIDGLIQKYGDNVNITFLVKKGSHVLFESDPRVSVQTLNHRRLPFLLNPTKWHCVLGSWVRPFDLVINMQVGDIANDLMRVLRVRPRSGRKVGHPYLTITSHADYRSVHAVTANLQLAKKLLPDVDFSHSVPRLFPPANTQQLLKEKSLSPNQYIVLNPGNSYVIRGKSKNHRAWPMAHWRSLIALLGNHPKTKVLINCAPGEHGLVNELGDLPANVEIDIDSPVTDLVAYLDQCALLVSSDTGTVHLAAALKTPIIGLYGPTNEINTGAYPTDHPIFKILHTDIHCRPCTNTPQFKACNNNLCMQRILPDQVFQEIGKVVDLKSS